MLTVVCREFDFFNVATFVDSGQLVGPSRVIRGLTENNPEREHLCFLLYMEPEVDVLQKTYRFPVGCNQEAVHVVTCRRRISMDATGKVPTRGLSGQGEKKTLPGALASVSKFICVAAKDPQKQVTSGDTKQIYFSDALQQ